MHPQLQAVSEALGALVWGVLVVLRWIHAQFILPAGSWISDSLLPVYEESVKAFVREWFAVLNRNINTFSAFVLSLFSGRSYRRTAARRTAAHQQAWYQWYQSAVGTFNALLEQEGLTSRVSSYPIPLEDAAEDGFDEDGLEAYSTAEANQRQQQQQQAFAEEQQQQQREERQQQQEEREKLKQQKQRQERHPGDGSRAPSSGTNGASSSSSTDGSRWQFWRRWRRSTGASSTGASPAGAAGAAEHWLRRGSALFELPSGFAVSQMVSSRGLLEELRVSTEVAVGRAFSATRRGLHRLLWLDRGEEGDSSRSGRRGIDVPRDTDSPADLLARRLRRASAGASARPSPLLPPVAEEAASVQQQQGKEAAAAAAAAETGAGGAGNGWGRPRRRPSRRPPLKSLLRSGRHWEEDLSVWTASDVILREGYPLEQHSVTTADGYVLQMHRIPRHGARDVAFFQHGVLDTSLGWVSNGVVGSAAFAAYDAGFDVWLANSRSNAPRLHVDPAKSGSRYWRYTMNELSMLDTTAEVNHIHNTKMAELATPGHHSPAVQQSSSAAPPAAAAQGQGQGRQRLRRAATDSQFDALHRVDVHSSSSSSGNSGSKAGDGTSSKADVELGLQRTGQWQQQQQQPQQWGPGAAATAAAAAGTQAGQPWWQRLPLPPLRRSSDSWHSGGVPGGRDADVAVAAGRQQEQQQDAAASSLRRSQSAAVPLQQGPDAEGGSGSRPYVAVPISRRRHASHSRSSSGDSSSGGDGGGGGSGGSAREVLPYRLQAVAHSLGAATVLMYAVSCCMRGQPHRLRRLILMSPAGFHPTVPLALFPFKYLFPALAWLVDRTPGLRGRGMGLRLPSPLLRYITFKLTMDLRHMPALHDLVRAGMRMMLSGDKSEWDAALQMPHYSTFSMPALSLHCGAHFGQWARDLSFRLFDYGSAAANREHYDSDRPPSMAEHYHLLDIPVDLLAGEADGIISPTCALMHAQHLRAAGVPCSYRVLPYGHMDFTFAVKEDIRMFVLNKLRRPL